jgi:hypothetical protein
MRVTLGLISLKSSQAIGIYIFLVSSLKGDWVAYIQEIKGDYGE